MAAAAADLPPLTGDPILRVEGQVSRTNAEGAMVFDLAMLDALPQEAFTTTTIWTDGALAFSGPSLAVVLEAAGASGTRLVARAVNDYSVEIPLAEIDGRYPILATRINGQTFGVRDKGPIWIVYPYDAGAAWRTEVNFGRSVWQLAVLTLVE
ncbi:hypothetical protein [Aphanothece microscopica]|uniref:hypothetical protein n=1 Tax=Aphanothece microscopica TaxID=1049561 RepID=UPI003CE4996F